MKHNPLIKFIVRSLIAALPVFVFVGYYVVTDPFKVIYRSADRIADEHGLALGSNAGFVSIKTLEDNIKEGRAYDSFIFGSSMSQAFKAEDWQRHLPQGASIFHLDASEETVQGMVDKVNYLHRRGIKIRNALVIIEEVMLHRTPDDHNFLFTRTPAITGDVNWLQFHRQFFNVFKNPTFVGYSLFPDRYRDQMVKKRYASSSLHHHSPLNNENIFTDIDSLIAVSPDKYYTPERLRKNDYRPLPTAYPPGTANPEVKKSLCELARLLRQDGTNYLVIMIPRYRRDPVSAWDMALIGQQFGSSNVVDFSRLPVSSDNRAYYDWAAHLTSSRCRQLLDSAYTRARF